VVTRGKGTQSSDWLTTQGELAATGISRRCERALELRRNTARETRAVDRTSGSLHRPCHQARRIHRRQGAAADSHSRRHGGVRGSAATSTSDTAAFWRRTPDQSRGAHTPFTPRGVGIDIDHPSTGTSLRQADGVRSRAARPVSCCASAGGANTPACQRDQSCHTVTGGHADVGSTTGAFTSGTPSPVAWTTSGHGAASAGVEGAPRSRTARDVGCC